MRKVLEKKSDVIKLRDFLYSDSDMYLERKKEIFDNVHYKKEVLG